MGQIESGEQYKIMKYYKQEILNFKPDIMVFAFSTDKIDSLQNLFKD